MMVKTGELAPPADVPVVAGRIGPEERAENEAMVPTGPAAHVQEVLVSGTAEPNISDVVTQTTTTVTTPGNPSSDELFWAEVSLISDLACAEEDRMRVENELKEAKGKAQQHEKALEELRVRIPEIELEMREAREQSLSVAHSIYVLTREKKLPVRLTDERIAAVATTNDQQSKSLTTKELSIADGWRNKLTKELLDGVKGIRKLQEIIELLPTAGHIEDLRGEASKEHKQFKDMLPKGSGQATADLIEEALFQHQKQFLKVGSDASTIGLAEELAMSIRSLARNEPWRPEDCTPDDSDSDTVRAGFSAFNEGKPYTALPTKNPELGREWMVGWVCGEVIAASATPQPNKQVTPTKVSSEVQPL